MNISKNFRALFILFMLPLGLLAQVTTGSITGTVKDLNNSALQGATVEAVHEPSGTKYTTVSNKNGKFNLPGLRVGGPYKIWVRYVGFKEENISDVWIQLGDPTVVDVSMTDTKGELKEVVLSTTARKGALISKDRKGTSTNISGKLISMLPTTSRNVTDLLRLTPQGSGRSDFGATSFAGQDNRFINFTLDGSIFNNSFGLSGLNGGQTNAAPISLDALQEIQVNISPYNVRDGGFTGAGINAVTKSGTNMIHGTMFYNFRNQSLVGKKAGAGGKEEIVVNDFDVKQFGISIGGPIIKNKLFYFANYEGERRNDPGTTFIAKNAGNTVGGNVTPVLESDLVGLSTFMSSKFNYNTGAYQGYKYGTNSDKAVLRLDWNINSIHKMSVRGNLLRSHRDVVISNSNTQNGQARTGALAMAYANTGYVINNDIYGIIAQLNSRFSSTMSNELTFGYTANRDYRNIRGSAFPTVDIQNGSGGNYITLGVDPFTPNNILNTDTWQFSDNLTVYKDNHTISMGLSYESFNYVNGFTPRIYGIYTFNNLADFYTAANAYLANPNATTSPVPLKGYSATWSNTYDGGAWLVQTKGRTLSGYIQDEFQLNPRFNLTYGVRFDVPFIANNGTYNPEVESMSFVNEKGEATKLSTSKVPGYKVMINPRVGFNYDINGDKTVQLRGGLGLFTGRPPFVYISNQMGNNGMLNGDFTAFGNGTTTGPTATQIPFKPTVPAAAITGYGFAASTPGKPATSYNVAATEEKFRFPQIFRSNLAVDVKVWKDIVGSVEAIFTQSLSNIYYYNANLKPSSATNADGTSDTRPLFGQVASGTLGANNTFPTATTDPNRIITPAAANNRINGKITDAMVMKSGTYGGSFMSTLKLEKPLRNQGLGWIVAYNFGYSRDYINPSSIAFSSWSANKSVNGNNNPTISFSDFDVRNRLIANLNYRKEFSKEIAIQFSLFYEGRNWGRFSYSYSGDRNGDGVSGNDLMYIPTVDEVAVMKFENYTPSGGTLKTQAAQRTAFENYIQQDKYMSKHRGEYSERNGGIMPIVNRFDLSAMVELSRNISGRKHTLQLRADIFNVGNLISSNAGVGYVVNNASPVTFRAIDKTSGLPVYRMTAIGDNINYSTFRKGTGINDVWQAQFGLRYIF